MTDLKASNAALQVAQQAVWVLALSWYTITTVNVSKHRIWKQSRKLSVVHPNQYISLSEND
jgi:hypothetical protein